MKRTTTKIWMPTILAVLAIAVLSACSAFPSGLKQTILSKPAAPAAMPVKVQQADPTATPLAAPSAAAVPQTELIAAYEGSLESLYQKVNPSVVNIHVVEGSSTNALPNQGNSPFGNPNQGGSGVQQALGSGFILDQDGHIVTNNHVIDGATKIEVTFSDGTTLPAALVGADPDSDLAVIKVNADKSLLQPVEIANSDKVKVGQLAVAIGNPFGLSGTMTVGIVSALERSLPANENATGSSYTIPDIIQTDAAINPGNSGGVLVNDQGQVIGVTSAIESSSGSNSGIGFAIPSAIVNRVVPVLIKDGKYVHSWLGISAGDLQPAEATAMNLPAITRGALIAEVTVGSPAEKAGLVASDTPTTIDGQQAMVGGDVITAIDGQPVRKMADLIAYLTANTTVGQKVTLNVLRSGKEIQVDVTLAARPAQTQVSQQAPQSGQGQQPLQRIPGSSFLGISAVPLSVDIAKAINLPDTTTGILVQQVQSGSPADSAGLKGSSKPTLIQGRMISVGGDVITAIDEKSIASVADLRGILAQAKAGDKLALSILRDGKKMDIIVTLTAR